MMFLEEIAVGEVRELGSHTFTAEDIKRFASAFDPQPFHLDEAAAARGPYGALIASGWHTVAVWMRLNVRDLQQRERERREAGLASAKPGPSPGFNDLKWLKPVFAGDSVAYRSEVIERRASRSRPGWGLVTVRISGRNQHGEEVMSFIGHTFVEARSKAPEGA
jgi:acyl dehydratase